MVKLGDDSVISKTREFRVARVAARDEGIYLDRFPPRCSTKVAETDKKIALTPLQKSTKGDSFSGSEAEFAVAVRGQSRKYSHILPSTDKYTQPELLLVLVHVRSRRFSQKESSIVCYVQTGSNLRKKKRDTDQLPPLLQRIAEMDRGLEDFFLWLSGMPYAVESVQWQVSAEKTDLC